MLIIKHTENFRIESPTILTIGTFDGVHLGHQKILERLKELKNKTGLKTVILTFEPHPRKVLFPEQKDLKLITTIDEKLQLLDQYGIDVTVVYPFSNYFSTMDSDFYIQNILLKQLNVKHLVIGYDHKFGKDRSGDINTLKQISVHGSFFIEEISAKDIDNIAVSRSKIRKCLQEGQIEIANKNLGHPFFLNGKVIKGKQIGRSIGYATANLKIEAEEKIIPKIGVYFVKAKINSKLHFGMMNIGKNPTIDVDKETKIEVHLFEFNEDIYDQTIQIIFISRLRDEKKFENLDELKAQLVNDKKMCLELMHSPL